MSKTSMNLHILVSFVTVLLPLQLKARIAIDVHGFDRCPGYPESAQHIDFTKLEFDNNDEGNIVVNGNITVLKDIVSPSPLFTTIERLERGQWRRSLYSQDLADLCAALDDPLQAFYVLTANMKQRKCPFRKGHVENFTNLTVDFMSTISTRYVGEWRLTSKNGKGSCTTSKASVFEARIAIDVHGFDKCPGYSDSAQHVDTSNLEFDNNDAGSIVVNGNMTVLKDIVSPAPLFTTIERLERGQWRRSLFSQDLADICTALEDPLQAFYIVTARMKQRKCPFRKGHMESFVNLTVDVQSTISARYIGEWRVTSKNGRGLCTTTKASVFEV